MSAHIQQTSASARIEAARKALSAYEERPANDFGRGWAVADDMADAIRDILTPPAVGESEEQMIARILSTYQVLEEDVPLMKVLAGESIRAAIQSAHETWEPETAQRPSQEQMLRWLGIEHEVDPAVGMLFIREQYIEKEEL